MPRCAFKLRIKKEAIEEYEREHQYTNCHITDRSEYSCDFCEWYGINEYAHSNHNVEVDEDCGR